MKIIRTVLENLTFRFEQSGVPAPDRNAKAIIAHALGVSGPDISSMLGQGLKEDDLGNIERHALRCEKREPLARVFEGMLFYGLKIKLTEGVFKPSIRCEMLIDESLLQFENERDKPLRILDLGTGSGCLLLSLLSMLPNAIGTGIDVDKKAVSLARENADLNGLEDRASFQTGDWMQSLEQKFDLVVGNLPAVATECIALLEPEMKNYDPAIALDGGKNGLASYEAVAKSLDAVMKQNTICIFQVHSEDKEASVFRKAGYSVETKLDYLYAPYCIVVRNKQKALGLVQQLANWFSLRR